MVFSVALPLLIFTCSGQKPDTPVGGIVTFEGTVKSVAPDPGMLSGVLAVFRLAKYRVERVCQGSYSGKEIVVDHLILSGKELAGVNVGDRVCVSVRISDRIDARYDADGIRKPSDVVPTFFLGEGITHFNKDTACCNVK